MNNLWSYIQGLSLSPRNQDWLAARLIESSNQSKAKTKKRKLSKEIEAIPEEFRCDPYEISPSGDPFFADRRNVEYVQRAIDEAHQDKSQRVILSTREDIERYLGSMTHYNEK